MALSLSYRTRAFSTGALIKVSMKAQMSKNKNHEHHDMQLDRGTKALMFITSVISLALIIGALTIGKIKTVQLENTQQNLSLALKKTEQALLNWKNTNTEILTQLSEAPKLQALLEKQISAYNNKQNLLGDNLDALRHYFHEHQILSGAKGFFIVAPDGTNIASLRDANVGTKNLIMHHRTQQFDRALQGTPQFIAPIPSDISIPEQRNIKNSHLPASAFFAAPIKNRKGDTVALLTQRIDPNLTFSKLQLLNDSLLELDIYSINGHGMMISEPLRIQAIRQLGLITAQEQPILSIKVSDPGAPIEHTFTAIESNGSLPLTQIASKILAHNTEGVFVDNIRSYRNYLGQSVFGAGLWSDEMGIGIIVEQKQQQALASYYWLRTLIITGISTLCLVITVLTTLWLRAHKIILRTLQTTNDNLDNIVATRTQESHEINKKPSRH